MAVDIDPIQYGALLHSVESLEKKVDSLEADIKTLLALANKSKGSLFAGMTIASALGAVVTWVTFYVWK